jgi:hypothetical protein
MREIDLCLVAVQPPCTQSKQPLAEEVVYHPLRVVCVTRFCFKVAAAPRTAR